MSILEDLKGVVSTIQKIDNIELNTTPTGLARRWKQATDRSAQNVGIRSSSSCACWSSAIILSGHGAMRVTSR